MRDRDAAALVKKLADQLTAAAPLVEQARARLRSWSSAGYPANVGGSTGSGGESHADPVLRTVQTLEIKDAGPEGKHRGWRDADPFGAQLRAQDARLYELGDRIRDFARELDELLVTAADTGEEGCALCNAVRLGAGHTCECTAGHTDCRKQCEPDAKCACACSQRDHRHPDSYQQIHNRRAPRSVSVNEPEVPVDAAPRCQFHYDFAARYGVDAHADITAWHLDHLGAHIPIAMIRERHPDEYARAHAARQLQRDRRWLGGTRT